MVAPPRPSGPLTVHRLALKNARAGLVLPAHTKSQNGWVILTFGIGPHYKEPWTPCAFPPPP